MLSQEIIASYFWLQQLPIKWDILVLAPPWPEKFKIRAPHLLRERFSQEAKDGLEMDWDVEAAEEEEGWLSHWSCDTVQRGMSDSRGQGECTGGNNNSYLSALGVSGLPHPGLFVSHSVTVPCGMYKCGDGPIYYFLAMYSDHQAFKSVGGASSE